ncbi:hypothetical protein EIP86_011312 [Pleurotus ostreatoroseus]|nr:hypothetical protein EIP86_011312 [Pleurotus ostreatoroseus]
MDISFDTTWCPVCSRQILPKRIQVPVAPVNAPLTPAPPPSPTLQPKTDAPQARITRNKTGTIRAARGGGLVAGTGRVKPNGTIKRSPKDAQNNASKKATAPATTASNATTPTAPVRHRTIIDQTPVPLYCSDECRLADLQSSQGIDINYNPERHASPPLPPVPPNSAAEISPPEESDSSVGSSLESASSIPSTSSTPPSPAHSTFSGTEQESRTSNYPVPSGYAALASIYDLPPCPPPPPLLRTDTASSSDSEKWENNYDSGIIMAGRRIQQALATRPTSSKKPTWSTPSGVLSTTMALNATTGRHVVPGWNDGTDKWRAQAYSVATLGNEDKSGRDEERMQRAYTYKGFVSTPLRSHGVYSTLGEHDSTPSASAPAYNPGPQMARARSEAEELYNKFDLSFARRSESRTSLAYHPSTSPTGSTRSLPVTTGSFRRKEVPILKKGAEGKLLVPDVKMRRVDSSGAMSSCSSSYTGTAASGSVYGGRRRSLLSRQNSEASVADDEQDDTVRSPIQTPVRSWSYKDDELVYPIMQLTRKEKRVQTRIVDGRAVLQEVEVEVVPERKRLFLFPGKSSVQ